jgi:eukaryotic-like serine/threonine-protein kinase
MAAADRDLLFGLLALQVGLIDQGQLVAAFQAWARDKRRPIADYLVSRGALDAEQCALLDALAVQHLKKHGDDATQSLRAIDAGWSTRESLARVADCDLDATLAGVGSRSAGQNGDRDADQTTTYSVGTTTSDGQRFRALRPYAHGGLGTVVVALDTELHREVALKQMHHQHADDPGSRARFLLEAEVTGGLEHPGIVPVYGLGRDSDGRPYYAMRFIRGLSLKEAIERFHADASLRNVPGHRSLELRKLLRRFQDVCNTIEYAHSRGVLHRDIKPGNIILGHHGETLMVDWGLAKATGRAEPAAASCERILIPSQGSGSAETLPGSALGTPAYMSPEQAEGDLDRLGPRSDVYSLGATLYCVLTGNSPYGGEIGEILRAVQQGDFPKPRQLDPSIDAALEATCLKAMARKPEDRYATPRALAEDVERWMADEPVSAWREPFRRRARRWVLRHRALVIATTAAMLAGMTGLCAVLAVQAQATTRLTKSNAELHAANLRERQRFDLALDAIKLFHGEVSQDLLLKESQFEKLRTKLLSGAAEFYNRLERLVRGQSDPVSRAALGKAYHELGKLMGTIGDKPAALELYRKSLLVRRELAAVVEANIEAKLDLARSLLDAGLVQQEMGDSAGGLAAYQEARELALGLGPVARATDQVQSVLGLAYLRIGYVAIALGKRDDAWGSYEKARAIWQNLVDAHPNNGQFQRDLAASYVQMGALSTTVGRFSDALSAHQQALLIRQGLADSDPDAISARNDVAFSQNRIGWLHDRAGNRALARASYEQARAICQELADANPNVMQLQSGLAFSLTALGGLDLADGRLGAAADTYRRAVAIWERLPGLLPGDTYNLACVHALLSGVAPRRGSGLSPAEGQAHADRAMQCLRTAVARGFRGLGWIRIDSDLDSLRSRRDFQLLLMDLAMPDNAFTQ